MSSQKRWSNLFYGVFIVALALHWRGLGTRTTTFAVALAASWAVWRNEGQTRREVWRLAMIGVCAVGVLSDEWWFAEALGVLALAVSFLPWKRLDRTSSRAATGIVAAVPISICLLAFAMVAHPG
jgi:hypothetical protein